MWGNMADTNKGNVKNTTKQNKAVQKCFSNCGPWTTGRPRQSRGGLETRSTVKILSDT
jgi:hypothetical protein